MATSYQEVKPSAALQPYVECYWLHHFETTNGMEESPVQRCMPFGALELIIHLDDNCAYALFEGRWQKLPQAFFVGIYRDTVQWKAVGPGRKFGIRLKPESMQLFNVSLGAMFNHFTELSNLLGRDIERFVANVYGLTDMQEVVTQAEHFLAGRLRSLKNERSYLYEALRLIRQANGNVNMDSLSAHLSISKRQLERSFKDHYGTSPKLYQRIIRFRHAYESFQQTAATPNWLDVSYNFGYADQAHFIRDFKEFSNDVPTLVYQDVNQHFRTLRR
ncbi:helix-turn-helix transcriptional regulator [Dyadobacter sandarakinus]|uniref:Helix-turn-helix transcriptional regulator n=1 Tax=Dyadobacter sandarakinus TaxID=2747268 RepID=A0ABX7I342_9BACT|nr:helix-turn-helix transcriptional regulator [Dyadobacter sandarakinus]QRR00308.1 helix-turn-helix transcriptional regulator [Dyadobacter sandarakinus]